MPDDQRIGDDQDEYDQSPYGDEQMIEESPEDKIRQMIAHIEEYVQDSQQLWTD